MFKNAKMANMKKKLVTNVKVVINHVKLVEEKQLITVTVVQALSLNPMLVLKNAKLEAMEIPQLVLVMFVMQVAAHVMEETKIIANLVMQEISYTKKLV